MMTELVKEIVSNPKSGIWGICVLLILFLAFQQYLFVGALDKIDTSIKNNTSAITDLRLEIGDWDDKRK